MERKPIISEEVAIRLVKQPMTVKDLLPSYRYQFENIDVPEEAEQMYNQLIEFMNINEELALPQSENDQEGYVKGFQRAMALMRLWVDSIYLDKTE